MTFHSNIKIRVFMYELAIKKKERIDKVDCGDSHENVSH